MTERPTAGLNMSSGWFRISSCSTTPPLPEDGCARITSCLRRLTDGGTSVLGRVLELGLANQGMRRRLVEYLEDVGLEDPVTWTRNIVLDRKNWGLSFDKWEFEAEITPEKIAFVQIETDLPIVTDEKHENERLADLVGQQVLLTAERRRLGVTIEVTPHPTQVRGLDHFTVQIISSEEGSIGATRKLKVWKAARNHASVSLLKLNRVDFEEGWHQVRVLPWTADGDPIPLDEPDDRTAKRTNESEPFYVLPGAALEEEPPQRAIPRANSVEHARLDRQFAAVTQHRDPTEIAPHSVEWTQRSTTRRAAAQEIFEAKFGKEGTLQISVARWLKNIEQQILAAPKLPVSWRMQIHAGQPHMPTGDIPEWTNSAATQAFLDARSTYFKVVSRDTGDMVSQGLDALGNSATLLAYAASYAELLRDLSARVQREGGADQLNSIVSLRTALAVDTVRLVVEDYRGQTREAALVAPTHPLRTLWHLVWSLLGSAWIREITRAGEEHLGPAREALLTGLSSINFPAMLPVSDGRVFTAVDNIHPFWPLYAPAAEDDPRGLLGDVCAALGVPEPSIGGAAVTGGVLASRIERYLAQHPYVRTLTINAFNPGRASVLADALAALQRQDAYHDLRYDIRLFVPDPNAPGVGEAIDALLAGGGTSGTEGFSIPTGSRIFPKLAVAVRATAEFRSDPHRFRCHLSILFDVFSPEEMAAGRPLRAETAVPLHGLVQEFTTQFHDDTGGTWWRRQPRHGAPVPIEGGEEASILLGELPALISSATATVARSTPDSTARPIIRLELASTDRALINEVHDASDWVFTIDRNMGIEFFDHGGQRDRPDYLIDYTPSTVPQHGHRLIVSSRSLAELEAILRPVLEEYGLDTSERHTVVVLDQLRSLSGRLALKLVSGPTARAEALGMALARMFLAYQGALRNQIVVPLDAHIDLFRSVQSHAEAVGDEVTLHRTDLALFDLNLAMRTVSCNLVEVKCCAQHLGLSGYGQLKERITQQINQSERVLQRHFDPQRTTPDRPDRLLKTRELATLLQFYLERGLRYCLMEREAGEEARVFLDRLEHGYRLQFSRSGLVFDFDKPGTEPPEHEVNIKFHRIGVDLIHELVRQVASTAPERSLTDDSDDSGNEGTVHETAQEPTAEMRPISSVPRLDSAAFLVADRSRSTSDLDVWPPANEKADILHDLDAQTSEIAHSYSQAESAEPTKTAVTEPPSSGASSLSDDSVGRADEVVQPVPFSSTTDSHLHPLTGVAPPAPEGPSSATEDGLSYDAILGETGSSPQYGLLGETSGRKIALDLNQTHTISLFGVQGGGKSYTVSRNRGFVTIARCRAGFCHAGGIQGWRWERSAPRDAVG